MAARSLGTCKSPSRAYLDTPPSYHLHAPLPRAKSVAATLYLLPPNTQNVSHLSPRTHLSVSDFTHATHRSYCRNDAPTTRSPSQSSHMYDSPLKTGLHVHPKSKRGLPLYIQGRSEWALSVSLHAKPSSFQIKQ